MELQKLLSDIQTDIIEISGNRDIDVSGITSDSRKVSDGFLFIALQGVQVDGKQFIDKAIESGASSILYDGDLSQDFISNITYIKVKDAADAIGKVASAWYGHPSRKLKLVGVTGTNGKTTTATLLYNMFRKLGYGAGLSSTLVNAKAVSERLSKKAFFAFKYSCIVL